MLSCPLVQVQEAQLDQVNGSTQATEAPPRAPLPSLEASVADAENGLAIFFQGRQHMIIAMWDLCNYGALMRMIRVSSCGRTADFPALFERAVLDA